jgi:glucose/arabinose dehydrogenase
MRPFLLSCLALTALGACAAPEAPVADSEPAEALPAAEAAPPVPSLEQAWIAEGFEDPEGIAMAPDGTYLVSNVTGEGRDKDGSGYVSKLSPDGDLIERYFAAKLNAPKGMAVKDGVLYVADIDEVVTFDAATGQDRKAIKVPGAGFLNDMTVWNGRVLVSDSANGTIIDVSGEAPAVWLSDDRFEGINGLLGDGDRLLVATMATGSLFSVAVDGTITEIASGMENADGIGLVPGGGYLVSSWPGQIHHVSEDGTVTTLLDSSADGILQNDLTEFGEMVIVPNWAPGTVTAWKVVR